MRTDVGHTARRATIFEVDTPVPVSVIKQPILRIGSLHDKDFSQIAGLPEAAHLLRYGIVSKIVTDTVAQALLLSKRNQFLRLGGGGRQRFFAQNVLSCLQRVLCHGEMLRVWRADVDRTDRGVVKDLTIVGLD